MNQYKEGIAKLIKGQVIDDPATLEPYSRDASLFEIAPQLVVQPTDAADIQQLVKFVNERAEAGLSLTARSAGTDMTGGPLTESIVVDMTPHFNQIIDIDNDSVILQPGVYYRDLDKETKKIDRQLPCYTASRELCTVGGMVANNSGGEKTLAYGKTEKYVKKLKMVSADGNEYTFEPLTPKALTEKMALPTFEGQIYRQVVTLIREHYKAIYAAKPTVSKNSAGYFLWNVWDGKHFDLTKLIVGSQGTLGIITEIEFKLIEPKKHSQLLVIFLKDLAPLADIVGKVLKHNPESFESYDDHTLSLALRFLPEIAQRMKVKNIFKLLKEFGPEFKMIMKAGLPKLVLLAEFTGDSLADVHAHAKAAFADLEPMGLDMYLTHKKSEEKKYWVVRRESFNLLRQHVRGKHTAPFIDDIVVRPAQLPQFLPELDAIMTHYDLIYTIAGHIGDANFHIIPLMDLSDPKSRQIIPELSQKVYNLVFKYKGSISGEHNDGLIRTPYLESMYGREIYDLFKQVKIIFDPKGIFNPGKKVNANLNYAMQHLVAE